MSKTASLLDDRPLRVGVGVRVDSGQVPVLRLLCGNAGMMTGPGTNTYLIGAEALSLIDPGPLDEAHLQVILAAIGGRQLQRILVTHGHADHSPGVAALQAATGAPVVALPVPIGSQQDPGLRPDLIAVPNQRLACGEYTLRLLHTPGHVSNHLCFLLEEEAMLFTGDHILQGATPVILPPDGSMGDYLDSLRRLREMSLSSLAPGHGHVMTQPVQVIDALLRHRLRREARVCRALQSLDTGAGCTLGALLEQVYDDVPTHLLVWAERTLLAHLIKLEEEGRAWCRDERWHRGVA